MDKQLSMLAEEETRPNRDDEKTTYTLGNHSADIPRQKKRRVAINRLLEILSELEGKDIFVGTYDAGGRHFWIDKLKIQRLELEVHPWNYRPDSDDIPTVIVLHGRRGGHVRIFTDYLDQLREQEYQGYWLYLLDFRNGFYEAPLDQWRSHYACLSIAQFRD